MVGDEGWWPLLLNGAVGEVIAGLATVAAVFFAFELERRRRRIDRINEAVAKLGSRATFLAVEWPISGMTPEVLEQFRELAELFGDVHDARGRREEKLGVSLDLMMAGLVQIIEDNGDIKKPLNTLGKFCSNWLRDPRAVRRGRVTPYTTIDQLAALAGPTDDTPEDESGR